VRYARWQFICRIDGQLGTVAIDYAAYPSGTPSFLAALASVEGLVPITGGMTMPFAQSRDGRVLGVYLPPAQWVERSHIERIRQNFESHIEKGARVRIYFHRGSVDPDTIADHRIELRRVPFALVLGAGLG
jgi:hypothetical protein